MLLTIGVPTYNRVESVSRLLHRLLDESVALPVKVMVVDDGSSDGTYSQLSADPLIAAHARLLRNETNQGYPQTFARIFAECDTEYVMVVADDDHVVVESLNSLLEFLEEEQPVFVSPQFLRDTTIYRGRSTTGPILPREFSQSSAHASGLIYRVETCRPALNQLMERAASGQADALVYPQVDLVVRLLMAARKCEWLALPTVREGSFEPSGLRDAEGRTYWSVEACWQQLKSFDLFLAQCVEHDTTGIAEEIRQSQYNDVFTIMTSAIRSESPELGAAFDRGARDRYRPALPRVLVRSVLGLIARTRGALRRGTSSSSTE